MEHSALERVSADLLEARRELIRARGENKGLAAMVENLEDTIALLRRQLEIVADTSPAPDFYAELPDARDA